MGAVRYGELQHEQTSIIHLEHFIDGVGERYVRLSCPNLFTLARVSRVMRSNCVRAAAAQS